LFPEIPHSHTAAAGGRCLAWVSGARLPAGGWPSAAGSLVERGRQISSGGWPLGERRSGWWNISADVQTLGDSSEDNAMSKRGSSASQSRATGASIHGGRQVRRHLEPRSMWDVVPYPLGKETGLPLIPCPDCGHETVVERRSGKVTTDNYLRVFFKCPRNSVSIHLFELS
jgi:hypothetical protein